MWKYAEFCQVLESFKEALLREKIDPASLLFHARLYTDGFYRIFSKVRDFCPPPLRICDVGCGSGLTSFLLASLGYYVYGIDIYQKENTEVQEVFRLVGKKAQQHFWDNITACKV
ncbi:MAG: hypothetical protein N2314_04830 [Brevinematales bacterium]|nr:hypothetical protein [Brevinematales bacterium]